MHDNDYDYIFRQRKTTLVGIAAGFADRSGFLYKDSFQLLKSFVDILKNEFQYLFDVWYIIFWFQTDNDQMRRTLSAPEPDSDPSSTLFKVYNRDLEQLGECRHLEVVSSLNGFGKALLVRRDSGDVLFQFERDLLGYLKDFAVNGLSGMLSKKNFSIADIEDAFQHYYENYVRVGKSLRGIWKDKRRRLLRGRCEERFQDSLEMYCTHHIRGLLHFPSKKEYPGVGTLDIYMEDRNKDVALIEIKWVGNYVSEGRDNQNTYGRDRITGGINQLEKYVEQEANHRSKNFLTVFNGLTPDLEGTTFNLPASIHLKFFFLVSETASQN